jgi:hypothetical protein
MTKIYQWGNQKPSIEKGQTILWPKDTNGVIRSLQLKRDRLYYIVLSVPFQLKASDYPIDIFWSWYCLSLFNRRLLITLLVYFGHIIVCPFSNQGLWLPNWYLLVIVFSVPFQLKASDYPIQTILWPKDTNGVIRSLQLKRDRQYYDQ